MTTSKPGPDQLSPAVCPVCLNSLKAGQSFSFLINHRSEDGTFSLYQCPNCFIQYWMPFKNPGPEWYEKCTQNLKHRAVNDKEFFMWMAENRGITKHFLTDPPNRYPKGLKLLDVGCGTGGFLIEARKLGYDVAGVDFDPEQIKTAKSFGLEKVYSEDVFSFLAKCQNQFDVITGFEIIEHVDKPREFIKLIYNALKNNGYLCLSTPNHNRIGPKKEFWDFPYHHLSRWSKKSLEGLVNSENFKNIDVTEELPVNYLISQSRVGLGVFIRKLANSLKVNNGTNKVNEKDGVKYYRDTVAQLGAGKDIILGFILTPIAHVLYLSGKKGQGLYLVAQK